MTWRVEHGDCLDVMRGMADASVDAVVTDPPYFKVKAEWWDHQWDTADGFLAWVDLLNAEWSRVLKPNGSLFVFASPAMASRVEVTIARRMTVLNRIVWNKRDAGGRHKSASKEALRSFFPASESIIFAEQPNADLAAKGEAGYAAKCEEIRGFVFEPLRAYLDGERVRAGIEKRDVQSATGTQMASHWFGRVQWALPTAKHYATLRNLFNAKGGEFLRREYEDLRREYEDLRREYEDLRREYEDLRRPFAVSAEVPFTDVWDFPTVQTYRGKHPCEKPKALIRHIIRSATRPGAVVLDSFAGSGVTGEVAIEEGRRFIGCEVDAAWCEKARERIASARPLAHLGYMTPLRQAPTVAPQLSLFRGAA